MRAHPYDDWVVLDVTASEQLADQYLDFASHGFTSSVRTNWRGQAAPISTVRSTTRSKNRVTGSITPTVGAGLPVNHTCAI